MIKSWYYLCQDFLNRGIKMIILNKPYVSDFLIETIKKNGFSVLDNEIARKYFNSENLLSDEKAVEVSKNEPIYSNSENSIDWVVENLKNSDISKMIKISKDKVLFRESLRKIYPDYYFRKVTLDEIKNIKINELKFPFVLKPSVGFLSFVVYPVQNEFEWKNVVEKINKDIEKLAGFFPKSVVDMSDFIIEEMIDGEEYALDAYYDKNGEAVILNIFHHPFFDDKDVSDRAYYTSKKIIETYHDKLKVLLDEIGKEIGYKNFPFHIELRINEDKIIPIEVNPMRFCGWCITDIAQNAWNINVYEYFLKQLKPNWHEILKNSTDDYFYFTMGDIPSSMDKKMIKSVNYEKYLKNISNPLVIRKIDYKNNPVFAIVFAKTSSIDEIKNILKLDMKEFIEL